MQTTKNLGLNKIELTDTPPDITIINPNWDKIDTEMPKKVGKENVVNNCLTTTEGLVLDARQGKVLQDQITTQNNNVNNILDSKRITIADFQPNYFAAPNLGCYIEIVGKVAILHLNLYSDVLFNQNEGIIVARIPAGCYPKWSMTSGIFFGENDYDIKAVGYAYISWDGNVIVANTSGRDFRYCHGTICYAIY